MGALLTKLCLRAAASSEQWVTGDTWWYSVESVLRRPDGFFGGGLEFLRRLKNLANQNVGLIMQPTFALLSPLPLWIFRGVGVLRGTP